LDISFFLSPLSYPHCFMSFVYASPLTISFQDPRPLRHAYAVTRTHASAHLSSDSLEPQERYFIGVRDISHLFNTN
jgi:hypothetical protein